jgi:hypothetical protein
MATQVSPSRQSSASLLSCVAHAHALTPFVTACQANDSPCLADPRFTAATRAARQVPLASRAAVARARWTRRMKILDADRGWAAATVLHLRTSSEGCEGASTRSLQSTSRRLPRVRGRDPSLQAVLTLGDVQAPSTCIYKWRGCGATSGGVIDARVQTG